MSIETVNLLTEEELDVLVSIAIHRAELLDEAGSPAASDAWHEVMIYEAQLSAITKAADVPGGIARLGAVSAALAAGRRADAHRLASEYLDDAQLPTERRTAITQVLDEDAHELSERYPMLTKRGLLSELSEWKTKVASAPLVFPLAA